MCYTIHVSSTIYPGIYVASDPGLLRSPMQILYRCMQIMDYAWKAWAETQGGIMCNRPEVDQWVGGAHTVCIGAFPSTGLPRVYVWAPPIHWSTSGLYYIARDLSAQAFHILSVILGERGSSRSLPFLIIMCVNLQHYAALTSMMACLLLWKKHLYSWVTPTHQKCSAFT